MPTLKDRIESNLVVFFLATMITGFLAGIGAYQGILKISDRETIASDVKQVLEIDLADSKARISELEQQINRASSAAQKQIVLRFEGVDYPDATPEHSIRVVAEVDGYSYSYPTRAIWADVGPGMSKEEYPLPVGLEKYRIRFMVFLRDPSGEKTQLLSQETHSVKASALPVENEYKLFPVTPTFTRAPQSALRVKYSIR